MRKISNGRTLYSTSEILFNNPADISVKKVFLEISQNPQENPCARVSYLIKLPA